jgi:hypothetical protein
MKLKLKNKIQQVEQQPAAKKLLPTQNASWEMSAQDALRINYVTRNKSFPKHS